MEQLSFFDGKKYQEGFLIPKEVLSPLESKEKPYSQKFKQQQKQFADYVRLIQTILNCSWIEARDVFFEHRDQQKPFKMD